MRLHEISPSAGSKKRPKRVGRGRGSGHGKTSTRGHKGQRARSGGKKRPGFEGGQTPLYRRIPKRGFKSLNHKMYSLINLDKLERSFEDGARIDRNALLEKRIIKNDSPAIKILSGGSLSKKFFIEGCAFSNKAREKIEKAGGEIKA